MAHKCAPEFPPIQNFFHTYLSDCNTWLYCNSLVRYDVWIKTNCAWLEPLIILSWSVNTSINTFHSFFTHSYITKIDAHFIYFRNELIKLIEVYHQDHLSFYQATLYGTTCENVSLCWYFHRECVKTIGQMRKSSDMVLFLISRGKLRTSQRDCKSHIQFQSIEFIPILPQLDPLLSVRVNLWKRLFLPKPVCTAFNCYYRHIVNTRHTWLSARAYCHTRNAELLTLNSFEEYILIMDILRREKTFRFTRRMYRTPIYIGLKLSVGAL